RGAWAARSVVLGCASPESVCSERVRLTPERRRRNSARKRSGTRTADGGTPRRPRGFWRAVEHVASPTEGERRTERLNLSGHKDRRAAGNLAPGATAPCRSFSFGEACGTTDAALQAAPGTRRAHGGLRRLGHAGPVQLADRRAPRRAPRRRRVRRLAHVRGRPHRRARACL